MKRRIVLIVLMAVGLASCVSTKVTSLKDPAYANHLFYKVLVIGDFKSIEVQKEMENRMVKDLADDGIAAIANYQLLPPLRRYTDDERLTAYRDNSIDCYLLIHSTGTTEGTYHVPTYTTANASVTANGNSAWGSGNSVTSGGYSQSVLTDVGFQADLFDLNNGSPVCRCESNTHVNYNPNGTTYAGLSDIYGSASSNLADEIKANHLFYKK
jgi:hypothetical protein